MSQIENPAETSGAPVYEQPFEDAALTERTGESTPRQAELSAEVKAFFATQGSLPSDPMKLEAPVKVISYMGSASDKIGNNGDFYLDEMTNVLYGPKADGVWPEAGIEVDGPVLCKRNFIQLNPARIAGRRRSQGDSSRSPGAISRIFYFFLRLVGLSKSSQSLTLQN